MQIHEITQRRLDEATPGSFGAQAGVFGSAVGKALMQKIAPSMNLDTKQTIALDPQAQAKLLADPVIKELANKQAALWRSIITDMLQKNNVVDVKDLPPNVLKSALVQQVNSKLLASISGNQINDYHDLTDKVKAGDTATKQAADNLIKTINVAVDSILATEPTKQNTAKLVTAWNSLVASIYTAANMVKFQTAEPGTAPAKTGTQVPVGQRLKVTKDNADYYKSAQGVWTNMVGDKVTNQSAISFLEKLANSGGATLERI